MVNSSYFLLIDGKYRMRCFIGYRVKYSLASSIPSFFNAGNWQRAAWNLNFRLFGFAKVWSNEILLLEDRNTFFVTRNCRDSRCLGYFMSQRSSLYQTNVVNDVELAQGLFTAETRLLRIKKLKLKFAHFFYLIPPIFVIRDNRSGTKSNFSGIGAFLPRIHPSYAIFAPTIHGLPIFDAPRNKN